MIAIEFTDISKLNEWITDNPTFVIEFAYGRGSRHVVIYSTP